MQNKRELADDEADLQRVLDYVQARPGKSCEEAEIKKETGVAKNRVRDLVRGVPGIDPRKLDAGVVCWNPGEQVDDSLPETTSDAASSLRYLPFPIITNPAQ